MSDLPLRYRAEFVGNNDEIKIQYQHGKAVIYLGKELVIFLPIDKAKELKDKLNNLLTKSK